MRPFGFSHFVHPKQATKVNELVCSHILKEVAIMTQIIELRSYQLAPGTEKYFHQLMCEQALPLLAAAGVCIELAQPSLHSPDHYILIRSYKNLAHRQSSQDAFYGSAAWRQGPRDAIIACVTSSTDIIVDSDFLGKM